MYIIGEILMLDMGETTLYVDLKIKKAFWWTSCVSTFKNEVVRENHTNMC